jgi:2-amino-4-hydroxy-6-hydroxymethyldihydropteridine diphosphokinase
MPGASVIAYVALGANLGDAQATLRQALADLATLPGTRLCQASSLYRSAPWEASGPDFINAVAEIETVQTPHDLLAALQRLEQGAGRERPYPNAPRTLDLDLLLYGAETVASPTLSVPHPRMWERAFVLRPLADIAPHRVPAERLQAVAGQDARPL